jgi:hypothetical protein
MGIQVIGVSLLIVLISWWLYMCTVVVRENTVKIVEDWTGNYTKIFSGIRGKRFATKEDVKDDPSLRLGQIMDGKKSRSIKFIFYGLFHIATYKLGKIVRKKSASLTVEDKKNIVWGDPANDLEVSIIEWSVSNHYRKQSTYELVFDDLETGKDTASKDGAQNVAVAIQLNVSTSTWNPYETMYQENDGGKWLLEERAVILSVLNELLADMSYDDLSSLRGNDLNSYKLEDGRTVVETVCSKMLEVKRFGQKTFDINFLDYKIKPESQAFIDALNNRANAVLNKQAAKEQGEAKTLLLAPGINAAKELMNQDKLNQIAIKQQVDATVVKKFEFIKGSNIRVYIEAEGSSSTGNREGINIDKVIEGVINLDVVKEITDESNDQNQQKPGKKGGNKS